MDEGITFFTQVPDEVTGELLALIEDDPRTKRVSVTREEEGVGILAGAYLGGKRGALIIQASGIGNSLNALGSLCIPCKIPLLLFIGERGGLHEFNPCQVPLGKNVEPILNQMGIQTFRIERDDEIPGTVSGASTLAFSTQQPIGVILTSILTGGKQ